MKSTDYSYAGELLDRYFSGNTSLADEAWLREYFASGDVAPAHRVYAPLFAYWAAAVASPQVVRSPRRRTRIRALRWVASTAAVVLLLVFVKNWCSPQPVATTGPIAGAAFPIETPESAPAIDWSNYEVSADEAGYRALRSALKTASTALNNPTDGVARELDKLGAVAKAVAGSQ